MSGLAGLGPHHYEVMPFASVDREAEAIRRPLTLPVTCSPRHGIDRTIEVAVALRERGHRPVPHLAARMVTGADHLERMLETMRSADVHDVFVVGGDHADPLGPYRSGRELIEALRAHALAPRTIGVPAYPEGHPAIADDALVADLRAKAPLADYLVTQLCFEAPTVIDWLRSTRAQGIDLPALIGVPGVVDRRRLLEISLRVGVGESISFLRKQSGVRRLLGPRRAEMRHLHGELAALAGATRTDGWDPKVAGLHVYTFNKLAASVALVEGR